MRTANGSRGALIAGGVLLTVICIPAPIVIPFAVAFWASFNRRERERQARERRAALARQRARNERDRVLRAFARGSGQRAWR